MRWRTFVLAGALSCLLTIQAGAFSDVAGNHWAASGIERWSANGVITGYGDDTFRPEQNITRGELAALLSRVFSWTETAENTFTDVQQDAWYAPYVLRAAGAGVLQGGNGAVRPSAEITRQEAVVMYYRAFGLAPEAGEQTFPDQEQIADWARTEVETMLARGWVHGTGAGQFAPEAPFTRAQAAVLLDNMVADYIAGAGAVQRDTEGTVLVASAGATLQNMRVDGDVIITGSATGSEVVLHNVTVTGRILVLAGDGAEISLSGTTSAPLLEVRGAESWVTLSGTPALDRILISGSGAAIDGLETGAEVEIGAGTEGAQVNGHICDGGTVVQAQPGSSLGGIDVDVSTGGGGGGGGASRLEPPDILSVGPDSITVRTEQGRSYLLRDETGETEQSYTAPADGSHTFESLSRGEYTLTVRQEGREESEPVSVYVANGMVVIDWDKEDG